MPILSRRALLIAIAAPLVVLALPAGAQEPRPAYWAVPVDLVGVPNLFKVTPTIYRSAQPSREGFQSLPGLGVKTVINLRRRIEDAPLAEGTGLATLHIKIKTRNITENNGQAIVTAMRVLHDAQNRAPVLLHCTHGADRTGLIIALWRMLYQDWPRDEAINEMRQGGYGFHEVWASIPRYLEQVDVAQLMARIIA